MNRSRSINGFPLKTSPRIFCAPRRLAHVIRRLLERINNVGTTTTAIVSETWQRSVRLVSFSVLRNDVTLGLILDDSKLKNVKPYMGLAGVRAPLRDGNQEDVPEDGGCNAHGVTSIVRSRLTMRRSLDML